MGENENVTRQDRTGRARPRVAPVVQLPFDFRLWLTPTVDRYPRCARFTVGDRTLQAALMAAPASG